MPTKAQSLYHHRSVTSARHAKRMAEGRVESRPEDYAPIGDTNEQDRRAAVARSVLEERRWAKELGL